MEWLRFLDGVLLLAVLVGPPLLLVVALSPFRRLLRADGWILFLLGVFVIVSLLLGSHFDPRAEAFSQATFGALPVPLLAAYRESVLDFRAPLWMPDFGIGLPALANPYLPFLGPLTPLVLFFADAAVGANVLVIAHLALASLGSYLLARSVGSSRLGAFLAAIVAVFNPWVFRRLGWEIHLFYVFAWSWVPLAWALLLNFVRTRRLRDAAVAGIPLAFLSVNVPTVLVLFLLAGSVLLLFVALRDVLRGSWRKVGALLGGLLLLGTVATIAVLPEQLAAAELSGAAGEGRLTARLAPERANPTGGGWRLADFSTGEFLRLLLPSKIGTALGFPSVSRSLFGVPFSPGEVPVLLALLGLAAALAVPSLQARTLAVPHGVLVLVLANLFVHGLAFRLAWRFFPFFDRTGIFPATGAFLLLFVTMFVGHGLDALRAAARRIAPLSAAPRLVAALLLVGGIAHVWDLAGTSSDADPRGRPAVRAAYRFPTMSLAEWTRGPHLAGGAPARSRSDRPRILCLTDTLQWPSPCLDGAAQRRGFAAVGIPEVAWFLPASQTAAFGEAFSRWPTDGLTPEGVSFARLTGAVRFVAPKPLDLPGVTEVDWEDPPFASEAYGYFSGLLQKARGLRWRADYRPRLFLAEVPAPLPRALFLAAEAVNGGVPTAEEVAQAPLLRVSTPAHGEWVASGDVPTAGAILFSRLAYPGHRALVNGQPAPVVPAQRFLVSVPVPAGSVEVRLRYAPLPILLAGMASLSGSVALCAWILRRPPPAL